MLPEDKRGYLAVDILTLWFLVTVWVEDIDFFWFSPEYFRIFFWFLPECFTRIVH